MMGLDDRLFYLIVGVLIGFIFGYFTRMLQKIEEKVDEVDKIVKNDLDERGLIRAPSWAAFKNWFLGIRLKSWTLTFVVALTAFSAFQSQHASNEIKQNAANDNARQKVLDKADKQTQDSIVRILSCNSQFLGKIILALNERTKYSTDQADANVELQKEQLKVLTFGLTVPPPSPEEGQKAVNRYIKKLNEFVMLAMKTKGKAVHNAYPTLADFKACISKEETK